MAPAETQTFLSRLHPLTDLHGEEEPGGGDVGDVSRDGDEEDGREEAVLR